MCAAAGAGGMSDSMTKGWTDPGDRLLAGSVFGTDDLDVVRRMISDWAVEHGFGQAAATAIELSVGAAVTVVLPDQTKNLSRR